MELKIYYADKPVILCDALSDSTKSLTHQPDVLFIDELSHHSINALVHEIRKENFRGAILRHSDIEKAKALFFSHFTFIEASGGIVENEKQEWLFILRKGKWDLPKGKMEENETPESSAEREIAEETGLTKLELLHKIGETYHIYDAFGKHYLKKSHWFHFSAPSHQPLHPQAEEDITEIKWFGKKELGEPLANTYQTIREILSIASS